MTKQLMTACPLAVSLILVCRFALADPGQEQACASRMADEANERMSSVRVIQSNAYIMGSRQVTMSIPGMKALCTADIHNNVVFFKFMPPD